MAAMVEACEQEGATEVAFTDDEAEGEQFMMARRSAIPAVEKMGTVLIEDVGVPISRIAELVHGIEVISQETSTMIATVGHAGDGNFHPLVTFDRNDEAATKNAEVAFGRVMDHALALGGVVTGEHGIGTLKLPWLSAQIGEDALELSRAIKQAFDPLGILNPGKAI